MTSDTLPADVVAFLWRCFESQLAPLDLLANDPIHKYAPPVIIHPGPGANNEALTEEPTW